MNGISNQLSESQVAIFSKVDYSTPTMANPSYEEIVGLHYQNLYRFAMSLCNQDAEAKDLTQFAFLQLARYWHKFENGGNVKSWLYTTLHRRFIDQYRRRVRFPSVTTDEPNNGLMREEVFMEFPRFEQLDAQIIMEMLYALEEPTRVALTLFYLEDFSYKEISQMMKIPIGTVMSRIYRGKQLLASRIQALDSGNATSRSLQANEN